MPDRVGYYGKEFPTFYCSLLRFAPLSRRSQRGRSSPRKGGVSLWLSERDNAFHCVPLSSRAPMDLPSQWSAPGLRGENMAEKLSSFVEGRLYDDKSC